MTAWVADYALDIITYSKDKNGVTPTESYGGQRIEKTHKMGRTQTNERLSSGFN